jgi:hypothetical protein
MSNRQRLLRCDPGESHSPSGRSHSVPGGSRDAEFNSAYPIDQERERAPRQAIVSV